MSTPGKKYVQKNGLMYEEVQRTVLKRVPNSADQRKMSKALATVRASRVGKTRLGEPIKPKWNKQGQLVQGCADYQIVDPDTKYCRLERVLDKNGKETKVPRELSADVKTKRAQAEQFYLKNGLSRKQQFAKTMRDITNEPGYLPSDKWGHHNISKGNPAPCDLDQDEVAGGKRKCYVNPDKRCREYRVEDCGKGTYLPGKRGQSSMPNPNPNPRRMRSEPLPSMDEEWQRG